MIVELYRKKIPENIRDIIYKMFLGGYLKRYRNLKTRTYWYIKRLYFLFHKPINAEQNAWMNWSRNKSMSPYPYPWISEYEKERTVYVDNDDYPYIIHNGKKLFFKKDEDLKDAGSYYNSLLIEQDARSAHRYVNDYESLRGKVLLDVGAAEAIFTLDVIDYIDHAYLFECDEKWIEAINKTFEPWKDKITIVRKYVSDVDDDNNITLDTFFKDKRIKNVFLKMDIEGYERKALQGAANLLKTEGIAGSVCIYHLKDDPEIISGLFALAKKKQTINPGYLFFQKEMRHAVLFFSSYVQVVRE